jgi:hypothetical protein
VARRVWRLNTGTVKKDATDQTPSQIYPKTTNTFSYLPLFL